MTWVENGLAFLLIPPGINFKFQLQQQGWKETGAAWEIIFSGDCAGVNKQQKTAGCCNGVMEGKFGPGPQQCDLAVGVL